MDKRQETPDVLGEILGEIPAAPPPAKAEPQEQPPSQPTSKPARKQAGKPAKRQARKPAPPAPPMSEEPKLKATFYLSPTTLDALEAGWLQLRRLAVLDDRGSVSKSLIVELSLLAALRELRDKAEESQLASMMARR